MNQVGEDPKKEIEREKFRATAWSFVIAYG